MCSQQGSLFWNSLFCLTPSVYGTEYASATMQKMQPDGSHLIQGHRYSEEGWMLLDKDDHLQQHLRPETILFL